MLTWSTAPGMDLRKLAGIGAGVSDEETAAEDVNAGDQAIARTDDTWPELSRGRRQAELCRCATTAGWPRWRGSTPAG